MNRDRRFYIAYSVCKFLSMLEPRNRQFKGYEFVMHTAELAECIELAEEKQDGEILKQYYDVLNNELQELVRIFGEDDNYSDITKVKHLISLLDEWKKV